MNQLNRMNVIWETTNKMEVVKEGTPEKPVSNQVPDKLFAEMKMLITKYGKSQKGQRAIRRALIRKFPQIPRRQWENTFPILFVSTTKQYIKPEEDLPN